MAVVKKPQAARLVIKVEAGLNAAGKPIVRSRSFKNVKPDAKDEDVYAVGLALANLQKNTVVSIDRIDDSSLISQ